jgi:hypothetical protein
MKTRSLNCWSGLFILVFALGLFRPDQVFGQSGAIDFSGPAGNQLTAFLVIWPNYPNSDAFFNTTVQDAAEAIPSGTYLTWCVDNDVEIDPSQGYTVAGTIYSGELFPTCDTNLNNELPPGHSPTSYVSPAVWQQVNYLLNNKNGANYWAVQAAIWGLVGGPMTDTTAEGYPSYDPTVVQSLLTAASNNAAAWAPQCGNVIGAIYVITAQAGITLTNPVQLLLVEVPYCPITFTKTPANLTLGCNPSPAGIPAAQNPVNTNLVAATSCCGYPVTITCTQSSANLGCLEYRYLTFTASDGYANTATDTQTITWTNDPTAPVILSAPAGAALGCNPGPGWLPTDAGITAQVTVSQGCSPATASVSHVDTGTPCAMTRTFTITATDGCSNSATPVTVVYTWEMDTNAPVIIHAPAGGNLGTNPATLPTDASVAAQVEATDNCAVESTNVTSVDTTNAGTITRTFDLTATDACGNVSTNVTVVYTWTEPGNVNAGTVPLGVTCPPNFTLTNAVPPGCTFTPGDYGAPCNGTNASWILTHCFQKVYPTGWVQCGLTNGGGCCLKFNSCASVQKFAPGGGAPGCLRNSYSNPASCEAGSFAGQVLCLQLNVNFGDAKSVSGFSGGCGDFVLNDATSPLNHCSVRQILGLCNTALGGGNISVGGCTLSNLSLTCSNLNQSFENGNPSAWAACHLVPAALTNVPPSVSGYATVMGGCSGTNKLTYHDVITAGTCPQTYVIARTWEVVDACGESNYCTQDIYLGKSQVGVCGTVFQDCAGEGFLTPGLAPGMPGVFVTLKNAKNVVVATNSTDANGAYCFSDLTPGTYTVSITPPTNTVQTAGTHTNHWLNGNGQQCWIDYDGCQHCKGASGQDSWSDNTGCQHWRNSNNQDCWSDYQGYQHTQPCSFVSCDAPTNNAETFTLTACETLTCVNFAYQGVVAKPVVCVTGPSKGVCGQTGTYTCCVTNAGTACFSGGQVTFGGNSYTCPSLSPGQGCSFQVNHQFNYGDQGVFNCPATVCCTTYLNNSGNSNGGFSNGGYPNGGGSCTAQGNCHTTVATH